MTKIERYLVIAVLGAWALFPDFIPGPVDDVIAIIGLIHQIGQIASSDKTAIE